MCRVRTINVGDEPRAAASARRATAAQLDRWELDELRADAELLVSELVTNAVQHSHGDVTLTLAVADGMLEVGVADPGPRLPPQRGRAGRSGRTGGPEGTGGSGGSGGVGETGGSGESGRSGGSAGPPWTSEGGRGLRLVDRLSVEWGVVALADGKQVWFRLDVGTGWPHRTDCPCAGKDLERVRLESGRWAVATPGPWDDDT